MMMDMLKTIEQTRKKMLSLECRDKRTLNFNLHIVARKNIINSHLHQLKLRCIISEAVGELPGCCFTSEIGGRAQLLDQE